MLTLFFAGDFYPSPRLLHTWNRVGFSKFYSDYLHELRDNHFNIINLECPLYNGDSPILKTGPNLKSTPEAISIFKLAGFNIATLANNHILDHGPKGLYSTIDVCRKNEVLTVGAGKNHSEASAPLYIENNGIKVALINIAENEFSTTNGDKPGANGLNPVRNYKSIVDAKHNSDHVIIVIHGGSEEYIYPLPETQDIYRFFIDAGASAVIGHHPHFYQGYELYKDAPIFYSLGNFLFPNSGMDTDENWNSGFAVRLIVRKNEIDFDLVPFKQSVDGIGIRKLTYEEDLVFKEQLANRNMVISDKERLQLEFEKYCRLRSFRYQIVFEPYNNRYSNYLFRKGLLPSFSRKKRLELYNLIRCESHREVLLGSLKVDN